MTSQEPQNQADDNSDWRPTLWGSDWSAVLRAVGASIAIHLLVALAIVYAPASFQIDTGWEGRMAELQAIGHGMEDFDADQEVDWDDMEIDLAAEDDAVEDEPQELEEEDAEEDAEDEELDEESEESEDATEVAEEDTEDEDTSETEETEERDEEIGVSPEDDPAQATADEESEDRDDAAPRERQEPLPAIDRDSPSNLPDLRHYGPGNARVTALVRTDMLRGTELADPARDLMAVIPDYRIALEGTGLDPIDELGAIFMASANPQWLHETFLAARHDQSVDEMRQTLDRRFEEDISWEVDGDHPVRPLVPPSIQYRDPRRLMLSDPGLAMVGRAAWFEELMGPVDPDSEIGRELAESEDGPTAFTLLEGLSRIEDAADDEGAIVLVSAYGFRLRSIPMVGQLPTFQAARLALTNPERPRLTIDLRLRSESEARQFERDCPSLKRRLSTVLGLMGASGLVQPLDCQRDGDYVTVEGSYSPEEVVDLLKRATPMVQASQPSSLSGLPDIDDVEEVEDLEELLQEGADGAPDDSDEADEAPDEEEAPRQPRRPRRLP